MKEINIIEASLNDYPLIQNMARFYVYDLSRECGHISSDWALPADGLYESFDFKCYFEDPSRKAYLVKIKDEITGFVLLNKETEDKTNNWNMGEFFILAKFQSKGIGEQLTHIIWKKHPGTWEVSVIPDNQKALIFWKKVISNFTNGIFNETIKEVTYDQHQPKRVIFTFDTTMKELEERGSEILTRPSIISDINTFVSMSKVKRLSYEKAQPKFWKYAGPEAESSQAKWFEELLSHNEYIMLTAQNNQEIVGFIIGRLIPATEVYNPGGLTLMIDDFCVESANLWPSVGTKLVQSIKHEADRKGAAQILVVCGAHDSAKRHFLKNQKLTIASEWFVGDIA
jgi:predicted acetyltransferase